MAIYSPGQLNDARVVSLWLQERPGTTRSAYLGDAGKLFSFLGKPLQEMVLTDLLSFKHSLDFYKQNSRNRIVAAVKSLFSFAWRIGYLQFNVAPGI